MNRGISTYFEHSPTLTYNILQNCLHSALLHIIALILSTLRRVDKTQICMHAAQIVCTGCYIRHRTLRVLLWGQGFSVAPTEKSCPRYCFYAVAKLVCADGSADKY